MTDPDDYYLARTPHDQAVHWFAKARLGSMTPAQWQVFEQWRAADPEHDRCYRELETAWSLADQLPAREMRAVLDMEDAVPVARRRRLLLGGGVSLALAAGAAVYWHDAPLLYQESFRTRKGERRQFQLPDGSLLDLNTATRAKVAFYEDRRAVKLICGEALFTVRRDAARPFTVVAGRTDVRATGTRFGVRKDKEDVTVSVEGGSVDFSAGPWWRRDHVRLRAGDVSRWVEGDLAPPYQDDVATRLAWQQGRLVFRDMPLAQLAAELNRYVNQSIQVVDVRVARLRVSGTLDIDEPRAALELLPDIAPVALVPRRDGSIVLAFAQR